MDAKTLTALKESIEHWRRMEDGSQKRRESPSAEQCALCNIFNAPRTPQCIGCPVMEQTGLSLCNETPFIDAYEAFLKTGISPTFRAAAKKEREFLESLLPCQKDEHPSEVAA